MNLSCYLIDDEPGALKILQDHIGRTAGLTYAGSSTDPLAGLAYITNHQPALTFLDIDMPELSGLALAELVRSRTTVIFTTGFREYAADAYEKDAVDFLLKPISYERFLRSLQKARPLLVPPAGHQPPDTFFVKTGLKGQLRSVSIPDILYAESDLNYLHLQLSGERITTYLTLGELLAILPEDQFSRIHKSFIVHHQAIKSLEYAQLRLKNQTVLPIGRRYRKAFREKMAGWMLISKRDH